MNEHTRVLPLEMEFIHIFSIKWDEHIRFDKCYLAQVPPWQLG